MSDKKVKVGILCESLVLERWLTKSIYSINELKDVEIVFLIAKNQITLESSAFDRLKSQWKQVVHFAKRKDRMWSIYFKLIKRKVRSLELISIEKDFEKSPKLIITPIRAEKNVYSFNIADLDKIKELKLDVILRAGLGILKGQILDTAKYGIWSFHHGDEFHYRGLPAGFWEIYYSELVCGVVLQKLTENLDTGYMLQKGYLPIHPRSYAKTLNIIFAHATEWPAKMIRLISNNLLKIGETPSYHSPKVFKNPSDREMLRFLIKMIYKNLAYALFKLFQTEKWKIGIVKLRGFDTENRLSQCIDYSSPSWLPSLSDHHFEADPFYVPDKKNPRLLFEVFDYKYRKGLIYQVPWNSQKLTFGLPHLVDEKKYHLAYPFCFEYQGEIYYYAESYTHQNLDIYRLVDKNWVPHSSIPMGSFKCDPTLLEHNGKWYMFYTNGLFGSNFQLEIKYSDSPFGPYEEHVLNPIKLNVSNSRSAGHFFRKNKKLIRPSQNCMEGYGNKITFHEVTKLSTTEYEEVFYDEIDAKSFGDQYEGVHTFNIIDSHHAVLDVKEYKIILSNSLYLVRKLVKKILRL